DVGFVLESFRHHLGGEWPEADANFLVQVLYSPFYRNKGAYVIGKVVNGYQEIPFAVPVLHDAEGLLCLDTVLLDAWRIQLLFSLSRAYFMVDMAVPSAYVDLLRGIMPNKPRAEIYTMLGLHKQGKTMFYRELIHHLRHSNDQFVIAPGIPGLVMIVFTLPSFPYVFKVIRDEIAPSKDVTPETVKAKYLMVKQHDRVGRMADTLEFSDVALPRSRFSPELLDELQRLARSVLEDEGDKLVIRHLYIERRMVPLNIHLDHAGEEQAEHAVREYGNAIRELAAANIFPGDMLWKNFGVTRLGRVVFYDYDEIEYLTDCNFRRIPPAPNPEAELSGEVWYSVARNDVFPEEFETFLLGSPRIRKCFLKYHAELLDVEYWRRAQERIRAGQIEDFFPYPTSLRFCRVFGAPAGDRPALASAA
ncbi:MAG: bifunctional isocitrate dehydrogenase kinase/phosphatase, partial [Rhodocyclales bacterium CG17_big_fil_post_rev_8_21_14_2_50_68_7]